MDKEIADKWVKALRSGKYKQGKGALCSVENNEEKYCCLGVLCDILKTPYEQGTLKRYEGDSNFFPPSSVRQQANLKCSSESYLSELNDNMAQNFEEIAAFIETSWGNL